MTKSVPKIPDENPPLDAAFMATMKPSRRGRHNLVTPLKLVESDTGRSNAR